MLLKTEDRRALSDYALFLKGYCNTVQDVDSVEEINKPSNVKKLVAKLPFKLRENGGKLHLIIMRRRNQETDLLTLLNSLKDMQKSHQTHSFCGQ